MAQALPARPNLAWLKKAAKERLAMLRESDPGARLFHAQLALARGHGFASWRALKTHVEAREPERVAVREVFAAARRGDVEAVQLALAAGFDPAMPDPDGATICQIAKERRHDAIEILVRRHFEDRTTAAQLKTILRAAQEGDVEALRHDLAAAPELIDALGGNGYQKAAALHLAVLHSRHAAVRLLLDAGADVGRRDFPDNATPLHFAALRSDLETVRLLIEAGADVNAGGDDYAVGESRKSIQREFAKTTLLPCCRKAVGGEFSTDQVSGKLLRENFRRALRRSHLPRRRRGRVAGRGADDLRDDDQSRHGESARPDRAAIPAAARRRGDRMKRLVALPHPSRRRLLAARADAVIE